MFVQVLNHSRRFSKPSLFGSIRNYCQNFNENTTKQTVDNHEAKLLAVLNKFVNWELYKHVLTQNKFNSIQKWKVQNGGSISKFNDILQIKGISEKTVADLRRFCESLLQSTHTNSEYDNTAVNPQKSNNIDEDIHPESFINNSSFIFCDEEISSNDLPQEEKIAQLQPTLTISNRSTKKIKFPKLVLEPRLSKQTQINSFTSLYQDATGVTSTHFSSKGGEWDNGVEIRAWDYQKVQTGTKHLYQSYEQLLCGVVASLPASDIYIMDDHIKSQHFRKAITPKRISEIIQMNQQLAILFTLLQYKKSQENVEIKQPSVHWVSYNTVGRMYDLFVGRDLISTQTVINEILHNSNKILEKSPNLPEIKINDNIKNTYFKSYPVERECLGKSMLIGLTFIRLGLLKTNKVC